MKEGDLVAWSPASTNDEVRANILKTIEYYKGHKYMDTGEKTPSGWPIRKRVETDEVFARIKVKGSAKWRDSSDVILINNLQCDQCGVEKHRHKVLVLCSDCDKKVR